MGYFKFYLHTSSLGRVCICRLTYFVYTMSENWILRETTHVRTFRYECPDVLLLFFLIINIFQRDVRTSPERHLDPLGPIASRGASVPVFLMKPIDFQGVRTSCPPPPPPLDPHMQSTLDKGCITLNWHPLEQYRASMCGI